MRAIDYPRVLEEVEACWRDVAPASAMTLAPHDNLFEGGADSFTFIRLVRSVEAACEVSLPLLEVFEDPQLATITRCVIEARRR